MLSYKPNRYLETILEMFYISLTHPYLSFVVEAWLETFKNYLSEVLVLQKKAICAINNLVYNKHFNTYFKCNKLPKLELQ